jgi:putative phosphoesterase
MRIAVLSDTHDRLPEHVLEAIREADEIWHLGDVTNPVIMDRIVALGPRVRVVRGNCDECKDWPLTADFKLCGQVIHLEHIPPRQPGSPYDLLLHGHTHVPRDMMIRGTRYLCPGTVGGPNKGAPSSYGWLTLEEGVEPEWDLVRV